jgi:hypothetical protein
MLKAIFQYKFLSLQTASALSENLMMGLTATLGDLLLLRMK